MRQLPLRLTYNNILNADYKPYLPIVGNKIPSKQLATFDGADTLTFTQLSGTATGAYDNMKSYHGQACYKVSLADNSSASIELDFSTPLDLTSLGRKQNNFALINQTGKYGNAQDQLYFIMNLLVQRANGNYAWYDLSLYNGTKQATFVNFPQFNNTHNNRFYKQRFKLSSPAFTYSGGFADSDMSNITKIVITITNGAGAGASTYYFQDAFLALPKVNSEMTPTAPPSDTIGSAYYPAVTEANSIFVSQLFGNDTNAGTLRVIGSASGPVKTIEHGISLALAAVRTYVVILDGATYKPVALDYSYVGIQQALTNNITIIADYLETPTLSAKPGLFDADRVGARATLRTAFYENTSASGAVLTVGVGGTYATIGAANTAASAGDCIQIIDSAVYNETLTANKDITIEAAPGQVPTWEYTGGDTTLAAGGQSVQVHGIIFKGNGTTTEKRITNNTSGVLYLIDCSFTNTGSTSTTGNESAIYLNPTSTNTQIINNCLFSNNNEYFTAINHVSNSSGTTLITNCIGNMGTINNNNFVKAGKANTGGLNIAIIGNRVEGSTFKSAAYFISLSDLSVSAQSTNARAFFNDTSLKVITTGNASYICGLYFIKNYVHDINDTTLFSAVSMTSPNANSVFNVEENVFYNINTGSALYTVGTDTNKGTGNIIKNIFSNCTSLAAIYSISAGINCDSNLFYNCNVGIEVYITKNFHGEIFVNCGVSVKTSNIYSTNPTVNLINSIKDNSPVSVGSGTVLNSDTSIGTITTSTNLINPADLNFGWYYNSPIETNFAAYGAWLSTPLINASGATLDLDFIDLEGFYNTTMLSSVSSVTTARYCNINNTLIGKYNAAGLVHCYNCFMTGNGQAIRENNTNIISQAMNKNNIIDTNGTGIMLLSGTDSEYNTIINNNYGITNIFSGFYNQSDYMSKYVTLKNNIVARNAAWDYVGTLTSDYSIMPNRYFDSLPITNVSYVNTMGLHDQPGQPEIDAPVYFNQNLYTLNTFSYFPDTKYAGFMSNSPAWLNASDTFLNMQGQTTQLNIGARSIPWVSTNLNYAEYDFNYVGTVDANEQFYALENPNTIEYSIQPINNESMRFITGEYENSPTAYTPELLLKWATPGTEAKILDTGRAAFEGAFQGIWVLGLSFDGGTTFIYYKVDKDGSMTMTQQSAVFSDTGTAPYGSYQLHLLQQPASFIITDYLINELGE